MPSDGGPAPSLRGGLRRQLAEKGGKHLLGFSRMRDGHGLLLVERRGDRDERDHAPRIVRQALRATDAGFVESHGEVLVELADKWRRFCWLHAFDRLGIVALAGGNQLHGITGLDFY